MQGALSNFEMTNDILYMVISTTLNHPEITYGPASMTYREFFASCRRNDSACTMHFFAYSVFARMLSNSSFDFGLLK